MAEVAHIRFDGLRRPVRLTDCRELLEGFEQVFHGWHFHEVAGDLDDPPIISIRGTEKGYVLESPWLEAPLRYRDPVSAVCAFIVDLIRGQVDDDPDLLCLHGAAAEFAGRLVVFPSVYRAGKSVLSACLAAQGQRLFADDVLPIAAPQDHGVAPGIMPRLRLPLPDDLDPETRSFLDSRRGLAGQRYLYLELSREELAERGTTAPVGGFVLLERDPEARPTLSPIREGELLRQVIWQNFARSRPAPRIMERTRRLVQSARRFRLRYAKAQQAVDLLKETFTDWPDSGAAGLAGPAGDAAAAPIPVRVAKGRETAIPPGCYLRRPEATEMTVDGERFLADPAGQAIHHLNPVGSALWQLLAEPMSIAEMTDLLQAAFPDVARQRLEEDVRALVTSLADRGLVTKGR